MTAPIHPDDLAEQKRIIRHVHVQHRPFPGLGTPEPEPETAAVVDIATVLAGARDALAGAIVLDPLPAGPTGEWETFRRAIGRCCVCGEPCRSFDPEGRMRHWMCEVADAQ